jgi:hypothetical protein
VLGERPFKSSQQYEDLIREKKKMEGRMDSGPRRWMEEVRL